jgi:putative two-component system response regulator
MEEKFKVLIIDDDKAIREMMQEILTEMGYTCFSADSGHTALQIIETEPVQIAIIDIMMPEMDGIETFRHLKEKDQDIAAVMMTGYGTVENAVRAMKIGAAEFLSKPIDFDLVPFVIDAAFEKRRLIIENREYQKNLEIKIEERTHMLNLSLNDLKRNFTETIKTFTKLIERRDVFVGSHSKRVALACCGICKRFDLSERVHHDIEIGALLHDIGKIVIPDEILKKSSNFLMRGKLDPKEEKIIRQHPIIGQDTVAQIEILRPLGIIIRHHHEHFNGSGYPDGLSRDAIPFGSRIICVANAYDDVVNTVDEKRREIVHKIVVEHLQKKAGELYDPEVVERFLDYIEETLAQKSSSQEFQCAIDELKPGMILSRDLCRGNGFILVPQYEKLDEIIIDRIKLFNMKTPLVSGIYIYESSTKLLYERRKYKKEPTY